MENSQLHGLKRYGDIKIQAKSSKEAKAKLRSMTKQELVRVHLFGTVMKISK